ncbi:hypothetical protein FOA52_011898 [Chlamydomonas sp. UWO 241]|nr:hypothetical protein FOA52_011898 [Chlamydomonas sp. UWO 241]
MVKMSLVKDAGLVCAGMLTALLGAMLVVYAPQLKLGGGPTTTTIIHARNIVGDSAEMGAQLVQLKEENARLLGLLEAKSSTGSPDPTDVHIPLVKFFGPHPFTTGISYDPYVCFPDLKTVFPNMTDFEKTAILQRATGDLVDALAAVHKVDKTEIDPQKMYHQQKFNSAKFTGQEPLDEILAPLANDKIYQEWRHVLAKVLAPYLCDAFAHLHIGCPSAPALETPMSLGMHCRDVTWEQAVEKGGYHGQPYATLHEVARVISEGTCMTHKRDDEPSFAHWVAKDRMFNQDWKTFDVENLEQDAVVFLFDMLYEKMHVFLRQYWMGIVTMQNPFDMYSIQDIIYTNQPDLLIETGTAGGGSANLWSSIMELAEMEDSKIVTIDVNDVYSGQSAGWGGRLIARQDPTQTKLWKKRVQFIKGHTTDPVIFEQVKKAAEGKAKVMVTLDSGHHKQLVAEELKLYCMLVTVGEYCVVEDMKMSRWHSTGPYEAVKEFLAEHPDLFVIDRTRELLYTHHAMGYLKRVK